LGEQSKLEELRDNKVVPYLGSLINGIYQHLNGLNSLMLFNCQRPRLKPGFRTGKGIGQGTGKGLGLGTGKGLGLGTGKGLGLGTGEGLGLVTGKGLVRAGNR